MAMAFKTIISIGLILATTSSINYAENIQVTSLLQDYFKWKLDTFKLTIVGFGTASTGDLNFDRLKVDCENFTNRANMLLKQNHLEVGEKRYVKVLKQDTEVCEHGARFRVYIVEKFQVCYLI